MKLSLHLSAKYSSRTAKHCAYKYLLQEGTTLLLMNDGTTVACNSNIQGECSIPPFDASFTYIQVAAGLSHTVLLRSDGIVSALFGLGTHSELRGTLEFPPYPNLELQECCGKPVKKQHVAS